MKCLPAMALALGLFPLQLPAAPRPMELADLFKVRRVSDPQISPDGRWVAFVVTRVLLDENRTDSDLWLVPADGSAPPRQLTASPRHDRHPRWSPDGQWLAFESNRGGQFQIWTIPVAGGEARPLTTLATEATAPQWSPDGRHVAFVSAVLPEFSERPFAEADRLNKEQLEAREKNPVQARLLNQLLYRHWDAWVDGRRQHVFVVPVAGGEAAGEPRNLTPGDRDAVPTSSTFSAGDEFAFSPDGRELAFTATPVPTREEAWLTNHDLYVVDVATGARRQLTTNPAADGAPRYSPDGRWLAYRAQARPGFEADRWQIHLFERATGRHRSLTADFDRSVDDLAWSADGRELVFTAEDQGHRLLWAVRVEGGAPRRLTERGNAGAFSTAAGRVVMHLSGFNRPAEVTAVPLAGGAVTALTALNGELTSQWQMNEPESVTVPGAGGTPVQMWILKPPGFDPARKWPLVFWVHGGPQGAFLDSWSPRWNAQLWAAQGRVLALPNPRGSTGFGQQFTDEISRDWGGRIFEDLMAGLAHLERQPWIDTERMAAAGASFGGYMMNWFQGHTDKFRTLVTHCGVYNFHSMYGVTEELWFAEWDTGIPWETPDFEKFSPHRFAGRFKTPNLIIHGELDFRVPIGEGLQLFTALQRRGVPSRLLYFPDEGHWVQKPRNSELWHTTIFGWLDEYLGR